MSTTQIRERPILFSGPMVKALFAGTKTQTRRVVRNPFDPNVRGGGWDVDSRPWPVYIDCHGVSEDFRSPYGRPGDRLWVRETWAPAKPMGELCRIPDATYACFPDGSQKFKSGEYYQEKRTEIHNWPAGWEWCPSIHMPRWASRLTLEVEQVRVERVQEISEADAVAEGVSESWTETWWQGYREFNDDLLHQQATGDSPPDWMIEPKKMKMDHMRRSAKMNFRSLWDSINGRGYSWESNCWVWVVTFKVVSDSVSVGK